MGLFLIFCMRVNVFKQISTTSISDDDQEMFLLAN